jgi:hypothetical protein
MNPLPKRDRLRALLAYDENTGVFSWLTPTSNRVKIGDKATCRDRFGYVVIRLDGVMYKAHRLAWLYYYGEDPPTFIDHIDMDKTNNKIANLRLATKSQNQANTRARRDNALGVKGVYFDAARDKYQVKLRRQHIGRFDALSDAIAAYKEAATRAFGCFART